MASQTFRPSHTCRSRCSIIPSPAKAVLLHRSSPRSGSIASFGIDPCVPEMCVESRVEPRLLPNARKFNKVPSFSAAGQLSPFSWELFPLSGAQMRLPKPVDRRKPGSMREKNAHLLVAACSFMCKSGRILEKLVISCTNNRIEHVVIYPRTHFPVARKEQSRFVLFETSYK